MAPAGAKCCKTSFESSSGSSSCFQLCLGDPDPRRSDRMGELALQGTFLNSLSYPIKDRIATRDEPESLDKLVKLTISIDDHFLERRRETNSNSQQSPTSGFMTPSGEPKNPKNFQKNYTFFCQPTSGFMTPPDVPDHDETIVPPTCEVGALSWPIEKDIREALISEPDPGGGPPGTLFVPMSTRAKELHWLHSNKLSCHPGTNRMLSFAKTHFWWPSMSSYVKAFASACPTCARSLYRPV